jgi:hypothetical protein
MDNRTLREKYASLGVRSYSSGETVRDSHPDLVLTIGRVLDLLVQA